MDNLINKLRRSGVRIHLSGDQLALHISAGVVVDEQVLHEVRQHKEALISYLCRHKDTALSETVSPARPNEQGHYEAFHHQKKEYLRFLALGNHAFNMNFVLQLENADTEALERAMYLIFERHESLRTTYIRENGIIWQRIHPMERITLPINRKDIAQVADKEKEALELLQLTKCRPFNLEEELPVEIQLVRYDDHTYFLSFTIHHVGCDEASISILKNEIGILYEWYRSGKKALLPQPTCTYKDYACRMNHLVRSDKALAAKTFYTEKICSSIAQQYGASFFNNRDGRRPGYRRLLEQELVRAVGPGNVREHEQAFGTVVNLYPEPGAKYRCCISDNRAAGLKKRSGEAGVSSNMMAMAAFCIGLYRTTGLRQIRLYIPVSTRDSEEWEGVVGWLTSEIIVCIDVEGKWPVNEFAQYLANVFLETADHWCYPHERLLYDLDVPLHVLSPVFLNFISMPHAWLSDFTSDFSEEGSGHFPLQCQMLEYANGMELIVDYNVKIYSRKQIVRIMNVYAEVLACIARNPETLIDEISLRQAI